MKNPNITKNAPVVIGQWKQNPQNTVLLPKEFNEFQNIPQKKETPEREMKHTLISVAHTHTQVSHVKQTGIPCGKDDVDWNLEHRDQISGTA